MREWEIGALPYIRFAPILALVGVGVNRIGKGVCYQYTTKPGVYAVPDFVSLIIYNKNIPFEWQRIACCKELVHVCEKELERTSTPEAVSALSSKLVGRFSTEDYGISDYMALWARLALYPALGLLFPEKAREQARTALHNGSRSSREIAEWACLPEPLVCLALQDDWPDLLASILDM